MQILKKQNTLTASFLDGFSENARQYSEAYGYLTLEQENGLYYISFTKTVNPVKKAGHLAVESADMVPEAAKIAWRVGSLTAKAFMGIKPDPYQRFAMKEGSRNDSKKLSAKYEKHKKENFNLDKLENRFFRAALSNRTQLIVFPGKEKVEKIGMSSLLIMRHRVIFCEKDSEVVCFRFSGSTAATQWANLMKSKLPGISIQTEEPRDIFHRI